MDTSAVKLCSWKITAILEIVILGGIYILEIVILGGISSFTWQIWCSTRKPTKWPVQQNDVQPVKTQFSLGICPVWSVFAVQSVGSYGPKVSTSKQRRLIRLGGCPSWSESSLDAKFILLVLLCCGSNFHIMALLMGWLQNKISNHNKKPKGNNRSPEIQHTQMVKLFCSNQRYVTPK